MSTERAAEAQRAARCVGVETAAVAGARPSPVAIVGGGPVG